MIGLIYDTPMNQSIAVCNMLIVTLHASIRRRYSLHLQNYYLPGLDIVTFLVAHILFSDEAVSKEYEKFLACDLK